MYEEMSKEGNGTTPKPVAQEETSHE
jgi:hypothetical protein